MKPMADSCECASALTDLHDFFAAWYRGDEAADLGQLEAALDAEFRLVTPDAALVDRAAIVAATAAKRGAYRDAAIRVVPRTCTRLRGVHIATYEEWQADDPERPARLSTAVLTHDDGRWRWHVVHETWMTAGDDTVG